MATLTGLLTSWSSIYSNHAAIRTIVSFVHIGALILGGGLAVSADRAVLTSRGQDQGTRGALLTTLHGTHRIVMIALALIVASGVLLFASDFDTFVYSRFFWSKIALVVLLVANGGVLWRAERRAAAGDASAWRTLRTTAIASITLWFLTTLGGAVLPNIG